MQYIVITGVSTGIGYDAVKKLILKGYTVFGSVRKMEDAERLKEDFGENYVPLIFDTRDNESILKEAEKVRNILDGQPLTALINNAGVAIPGPLQCMPEEDFARQMDINVNAVRRVTNAFLPMLGAAKGFKGKPGKIINISSISGLFNSPYNGAYCISKHALESMTDIYRRELIQYGIDVVAIQPGPIKTEIWKKSLGSMDKYKDTDYGEMLKSADKMIANAEKHALPCSIISDLILGIITGKKKKTKYIVHKRKMLFKLMQIVPDRWLDRKIYKTLQKSENYRPV